MQPVQGQSGTPGTPVPAHGAGRRRSSRVGILALVLLGGCEDCDSDDVPFDVPVGTDVHVVVSGGGTGSGQVTSAAAALAALDCGVKRGFAENFAGARCIVVFYDANAAGTFALQAVPAAGHAFVRWEQDCSPSGTDPVCWLSFSPGDIEFGNNISLNATAVFEAPIGTLQVTTVTTPAGFPDHDFELRILRVDHAGDTHPHATVPLPPNGTRDIELSEFSYRLEFDLQGATTCTIESAADSVEIIEAAVTPETFVVACSPPDASFTVETVTTGVVPDPDGYQLFLDDVARGAIGINDTRSFSAAAGTHSLRLDGVADNCNVDGDNPREFPLSVGSAPVQTFLVECAGPNAPGLYTLISIKDVPLPVVVEGVEIVSVTLELKADGTFVLVETYRETPGEEPTKTSTLTGTWTLDGIELTLAPDDQSVNQVGTFEGADIVFLFDGEAYRFQLQT